MPTDLSNMPPVHRDMVVTLCATFGQRTFTASAAATALSRPRGSTATYLSMLVRARALFRTQYGLYSCVEPREGEIPPKSVSTMEKIERHLAEEAQKVEKALPIDPVAAAIETLSAVGIQIKRRGDIFLIDGGKRLTEEILLRVAQMRRIPRSQDDDFRSARIAALPTRIPEPSPEQRMRGR